MQFREIQRNQIDVTLGSNQAANTHAHAHTRTPARERLTVNVKAAILESVFGRCQRQHI